MDFEIDIQDFVDEAEEQIKTLNDGLLSLEKDKHNEEIINEVFRAAHTLKGGSGLVGFDKITQLTHRLENIFDLIRDKKLELTSDHLDVMFEVLDLLMELMGEVDSGTFTTDIEGVSKRLEDIIAEEKGSPPKPEPVVEVVEEASVEADEAEPEVVDKEQTRSEPKTLDEMDPDEMLAHLFEEEKPVVAPVVAETGKAKGKGKKKTESQDKEDNPEHSPIEQFLGREIDTAESDHIETAKNNESAIFGAKIKILETCDVISLFMFMLFNKVKELGEVIISIPSEEELDSEEFFEVKIVFSSIVPFLELKSEFDMPEIEKLEIVEFTSDGGDSISSEGSFFSKPADKPVVESASKTVKPIENASVKAKASVPAVKEVPPTPPAPPQSPRNKGNADKDPQKRKSTTLRVDSLKIDSLLNLAGELVINKARFITIAQDLEKKFGRENKVSELKDTVGQLMHITNELQEGIMQLRMVPIDTVFSKFARVVRDMSRKLDKKINLIVEGKETELDKSVVEEISDPLMHLVRNSVDHGVETTEVRTNAGKSETGNIWLRAYHEGSSIVIEIQDDGKGINSDFLKAKAIEKGIITSQAATQMSEKEALNLIFAPGFSTAAVVSNISGRGVGMDVVRRNVEALNGVIDISTEVGTGSIFSIKLPLTLAIISTLLTKIDKYVYAIPLVNVIEIVEISRSDIYKIANHEAIRIRKEVVNILRLGEIFNFDQCDRSQEKMDVVIVGLAEHRVGFVVDSLIGESEVVIKSLDNELIDSPGIAGASILGDGTVSLIVDVYTLIEKVLEEANGKNAIEAEEVEKKAMQSA